MTANYIDQITNSMIRDVIGRIVGASVEYTGGMGAYSNEFIRQLDREAHFLAMALSVYDVQLALNHEIAGDNPIDEIKTACSIASEPHDMPEGACVSIQFRV